MNIKVQDIMVTQVVTSLKHKNAGHIKRIMELNNINSVPIVDSQKNIVGIVTSSDLLTTISEKVPVSKIMTKNILSIPEYENIHIAARMMRNHQIHHLIVCKDKKMIGVLSSFDLLKLIENHRFSIKNSPPRSKKANKRF